MRIRKDQENKFLERLRKKTQPSRIVTKILRNLSENYSGNSREKKMKPSPKKKWKTLAKILGKLSRKILENTGKNLLGNPRETFSENLCEKLESTLLAAGLDYSFSI